MKQEKKFDARNMTTEQLVAIVQPLCETMTHPNDGTTTLTDWIDAGSFDGTETPESLAAEWDEYCVDNNQDNHEQEKIKIDGKEMSANEILWAVEALCMTETRPKKGMLLWDFLYVWPFDGTETIEALAREWDRLHS